MAETRLSVNVNKIALLRNAREGELPSVVGAARICLEAGCHGITAHPRPDQRHIRPRDVERLAALVAEYDGIEFNLEGNPFESARGDYPGYMELARRARPAQATLVPDAPGQLTSDHGWDFEREGDRLGPVIEELRSWGCRVSLFVDADPRAAERAAEVGADRIELYTGPWAASAAHGPGAAAPYAACARRALALGLGVNAGHDLNLENVGPFLGALPAIDEVSIGHALIADALGAGLGAAVEAYLRVIEEAEPA